ncbi:MAG: tetratricopeptide repeat protein [Leptospiraceae bacterium]|nr:tetratricopeptide repeat protein [Leptospiraceae bacterium]
MSQENNKRNCVRSGTLIVAVLIASLAFACDFFSGRGDTGKAAINQDIGSLLQKAAAATDENEQAKLFGQASLLLSQKGDYKRAVDAARKGRRANPMEVQSLATIGEYYISQRKFAEAQTVLEEAIYADGKSARANYLLGNALYAQKQTGRAQDQYAAALALDPQYTDALYNLAALHASQGRASQALDLLEKAIALKPGFAEPYKNAGIAAEKSGNAKKAKEYYSKYIELNPAGDDVEAVEQWIAKLN